MKFNNNVKYFCMIRELFEYMSMGLVAKDGRFDNYIISISNQKIKEIFNKANIDYSEFEDLIQDIAQKLFEEGKYYLNIITTKNSKKEITDIDLYRKMPEEIGENQEKIIVKIRNNIKILNELKRRILLYKLLNMNEYKIKDYNSSDELTYFSEKEKIDKYKLFKITKNMYIQTDTPEEITTYYHNYRIIKMRMWQVRFVKNIIKQLNLSFEKIFNEKDIIKYEGITVEELNKYLVKLNENKISMSELTTKIFKVESI